jgi:hypothetical protein
MSDVDVFLKGRDQTIVDDTPAVHAVHAAITEHPHIATGLDPSLLPTIIQAVQLLIPVIIQIVALFKKPTPSA